MLEMKPNNIQTVVQDFISNNKIDDALTALSQHSESTDDSDLQNTTILLKSRLTRINQQENLGLVSMTDSLREKAIISNSILDITSRLENIEMRIDKIDGADTGADKSKRILFLASNPSDTGKLQLEKEFSRVFTSLQNGEIKHQLFAEFALTTVDLQNAIIKHKPNIVHFSGHGESGNEYKGGILLNDSNGKAKLVNGLALADLFEIMKMRYNIEIVLLNACYSREQADGIKKHIPFVIGMDDAINDNTAIEFATGFYRGLAEDNDVNFAFRLAINAVQIEGLEGDNIPVLLD